VRTRGIKEKKERMGVDEDTNAKGNSMWDLGGQGGKGVSSNNNKLLNETLLLREAKKKIPETEKVSREAV